MTSLTNLEILHNQIIALMSDKNTIANIDQTFETQSSSFSETRIRVKYIGNDLYHVSISVDYTNDRLAGVVFTLKVEDVTACVTAHSIATINDDAIRSLQSHALTLTKNIRKLI